jgi:hypothetical protein
LSQSQQLTLNRDGARQLDQYFRRLLFTYFTSLAEPVTSKDSAVLADRLTPAYSGVLAVAGLDNHRAQVLAESFRRELEREEDITQYLCWVWATPGDVLSLRASYTVTDPKHKLRLGTFGAAMKSIALGLHRKKGRKTRDNWYRQYGITPVGYRSGFPRGASAGSYYLTLECPANTVCTFLDWGSGSSFDQVQEVNCAFPAAHVHNEAATDTPRPRASELRTYLRCAPYRHKQILGAAVLNFAIVWLLARRVLPLGLDGFLQELILAAPSILVAFLAQRQSHYHAHVTRRQRAILWIYLAISVTFLVNLAFDGRNNGHQLSLWTECFAWAVAISSAAIFGWHLLLGGSYERVVHYLTDRKWEVANEAANPPWLRKWGNKIRRRYWERHNIRAEEKWKCFALAVRQYAVVTGLLTLVLVACAVVSLETFGHFPLRLAQSAQARDKRAPFGTAGKEKLEVRSLNLDEHIQPQLVITREAEGR